MLILLLLLIQMGFTSQHAATWANDKPAVGQCVDEGALPCTTCQCTPTYCPIPTDRTWVSVTTGGQGGLNFNGYWRRPYSNAEALVWKLKYTGQID